MPNWDNANTREQEAETLSNLENGVLEGVGIADGMAFRGYPLPLLCYKPVYMLTPYERGFLLGIWWNQWLKQGG